MKALLACSTIPNIADLPYPMYASYKLDGIRCMMVDGEARSRTGKLIPNKHVQECLAGMHGLDGELMMKGNFDAVQSGIMSAEGKPHFVYRVFDTFHDMDAPYKDRIPGRVNNKYVELVEQFYIDNATDMQLLLDTALEKGYEGLIVRSPDGHYKQGRSTMKQGIMLKLKVFHDDEGLIVDSKPLVREDGTVSNLLGAVQVSYNDDTFWLGSGYDEATRLELWAKRQELVGQLVTFKYQELTQYGKPRFPIYKGLRSELDV